MGYAELSDEQLMERVAQGDVAAHEALYDRYCSAVMGLAIRIIGDRAAAEEIVQETFWRVWRKAGTYQTQRGIFTSWFFSIVRNLSIDVLRQQRLQTQPVDKPEEYVEQIPDPAADVAEAAWLKSRRQKVQAAMETLPVEQRDVIERAYFSGMTHQEIARDTGEPLGTIHTRARLALQKLREALQVQEFDE